MVLSCRPLNKQISLSCCLLCGMQPIVELPPGATDPLLDNKYRSVAVERDLMQHSLRRAVVIDPNPGDLSGRRGPHVYRCDREMGAAGRRKQQLRGYVDGQTAGQARTNSMEGNEDRKEEEKKG